MDHSAFLELCSRMFESMAHLLRTLREDNQVLSRELETT